MKRLNVAVAAVVLAATTSIAGATTPAEAPDALVADAMEAPTHVSYSGTIELVKIGAHGAESSVFDIEHRAPDHTRKTFSAPANVGGDSVVVIGNRSYDIDLKRSRVVTSENAALTDPVSLSANYLLLRRNYKAVAKDDEVFAGRPASVLALVSDYSHNAMLVVRIDRATKLVLDKQQFAADGTLIGEMRFVRVKFAGSMPDADFAIPQGLTQVAGAKRGVPSEAIDSLVTQAGFAAHNPKFLPLGFSPVEGSVETIQGVRTLHLLYSDGVRTVSLFENSKAPSPDLSRYHAQATRVAGRDGQYAEAGPTTILTWSNGDLNCALVGDMQLDELQKIAGSI
ncbi:MAG TPA: sigma-E factor regulatory protein RseB domain-containing protein [Candidatus Acidoferrales bacterium]|jgi:negative regulator of sigma E activity|nr:sigma-E factor regulatory protein RseB domain-containing protein [Candidatus Acidoferrales bacterium]